MQKTHELFWEEKRPVYFTILLKRTKPEYHTPAVVREEDTPSPNAVMASNLQQLGLLLGKPEWQEQSRRMLLSAGNRLLENPLPSRPLGYFATGRSLWLAGDRHPRRVEARKSARKANSEFLGIHVLMATDTQTTNFLAYLTAGTSRWQDTLIYVCKDYTCRQPVREVEECIWLIKRFSSVSRSTPN